MVELLKDKKSRKNQSGQVAIFVALIFQVLFLFFAMIINVGLLVHHKINLQNSVDLAAYYGAMKQSEVLNAIGHINYQIRQSHKLLAWRYRVLGTSGVMHRAREAPFTGLVAHPVAKGPAGNESYSGDVGKGIRGATIVGFDDEGISPDAPLRRYYEAPGFCVTFRPFSEIPEGENTCREPIGQTIPALRRPPIIAGFIGAAHEAARVTDLANKSQQEQCRFVGPYNYTVLGQFTVAFNLDQGAKKSLIFKLANNLSLSAEDFVDIEGEHAKDGISKTLRGNLTAANKDGMKDEDFRIYNSLGHANCGGVDGVNTQKPPKWLAEVAIFPRSSYKMCVHDGSGSVFSIHNIDEPPQSIVGMGLIPDGLKGIVNYLSQYISPPSSGSNAYLAPSMGVEKNPWCMAYVGVRAESTPNIPFSLSGIKLKAYSFAKPFGGRIGPWYGKSWPKSAVESQGVSESNRLDPRAPSRCLLGDRANCTIEGQDAATTINYSRFPGDKFGMMSRRVHAQYAKSIFDMGNMSYKMWDGIEKKASARGGDWDILAWGTEQKETKMRKLEIAAVAPDIFDLSYYSIDPDYYTHYYKDRLEKYLAKNPISSDFVVPMDIGSKSGNLVGFNIKDQMEVVGKLQVGCNNCYGIDTQGKLPYVMADSNASTNDYFAKLLTSWVPPIEIVNYEFKPDERFGKCIHKPLANAPIPGGCVSGGRAGYSVKLISTDYLLDEHELGGSGGGADQIINQPPPEFYK